MAGLVGVLTRNNIACIHGIFVLDETEAIHELDLGYLAGAMGVEVVLNVGLGSYSTRSSQRCQVSTQSLSEASQLRRQVHRKQCICAQVKSSEDGISQSKK